MNNKMTLVESMAAMREKLHIIETKKEIVNEFNWLKAIGLGGKSSMEIAKKIGQRVETIGANGEKQIWQAKKVGDDVVYELEGVGTKIPAEDLARMKPKNIETDMRDPVLRTEPKKPLPQVRRNKETGEWEVQNADGQWVKYEKPVEKPVDVSGPDPLHPNRIDPPGFKNIEAAKSAADTEIQAGNAIVKAPDGTVFQSAADMESFIAKNYPESAAVLAKSPKKSMELWSWFVSKNGKADQPYPAGSIGSQLPGGRPSRELASPKHRKKTILLVALLIALGIYVWPKDKTSPSGSESGSASGASGKNKFKEVTPREAAIANASYGDQERGMRADAVDWSEVALPPDQNEFFSRGKDGKWRDRSGKVITDPNIIMAIVKSSKESRMQVTVMNPDGTPVSPDTAAKEPTATVPAVTANTDEPNPDAIQVDPNFDGKIKSSKSKAR